MKTAVKLSLGGVALLACIALVVSWNAWCQFPERHARSCLETVKELTDRTLTTYIPQGDYIKAIETAEYIQGYYPVGTVLAEEHPFAEHYQRERSQHIERILAALRAKTGMDYEMMWKTWKEELANKTSLLTPDPTSVPVMTATTSTVVEAPPPVRRRRTRR